MQFLITRHIAIKSIFCFFILAQTACQERLKQKDVTKIHSMLLAQGDFDAYNELRSDGCTNFPHYIEILNEPPVDGFYIGDPKALDQALVRNRIYLLLKGMTEDRQEFLPYCIASLDDSCTSVRIVSLQLLSEIGSSDQQGVVLSQLKNNYGNIAGHVLETLSYIGNVKIRDDFDKLADRLRMDDQALKYKAKYRECVDRYYTRNRLAD